MTRALPVTASLKGAIGETLLTAHKSAIREFFTEWCLDDLERHDPEWIPDSRHRVTFDVERTPHSFDVCIDGDFATWYPDALYSLRFEPRGSARSAFDPYAVEFPLEVKTGESSELADNQRAVMATIERQATPIVPLRVRVDVDDLPDAFRVTPCRIRHAGDGPLPEYSTDDPPVPPAASGSETESISLSDFTDD